MPLPVLTSPPVPEMPPANVVLVLSPPVVSVAEAERNVAVAGERADGLVEVVQAQGRPGGHRERAGCRKRVGGAGLQRAHIDVGRAGIVAAARERQRASAGLGQATAAGEGGGERDVVAVGVEGCPAGAEGGQL